MGKFTNRKWSFAWELNTISQYLRQSFDQECKSYIFASHSYKFWNVTRKEEHSRVTNANMKTRILFTNALSLSMAVHERCRPLRYIGTCNDYHFRLIADRSGNRIITSKVSCFSKHKKVLFLSMTIQWLKLAKKPKEKNKIVRKRCFATFPYIADLASADFHLFWKIGHFHKRWLFRNNIPKRVLQTFSGKTKNLF